MPGGGQTETRSLGPHPYCPPAPADAPESHCNTLFDLVKPLLNKVKDSLRFKIPCPRETGALYHEARLEG